MTAQVINDLDIWVHALDECMLARISELRSAYSDRIARRRRRRRRGTYLNAGGADHGIGAIAFTATGNRRLARCSASGGSDMLTPTLGGDRPCALLDASGISSGIRSSC
jgi:hypothetical protein